MWEQIRSNRIRSAVLVVFMGLLLAAVGAFAGYYFADNYIGGLVFAFFIWGILTLVAFYQGDSIVLSISGARKIRKEDNPRLYNVIEEMTIAAGLPKIPDIYIIDDPALNAFATGRDINHASVAITAGLLEKLNRDELQGVMAHELAHIKNRDVLLMVLLSVMMGAIVIISYYSSRMMFFGGGRRRGRRDNQGGGGIEAILMLVGLLLLIFAPIFAQLIYFALSRRREYLSDASSALYTRYPDGLASALEKLATSDTRVKTANKATAPMYIADPFKKQALSAESLTATHPPLADRIRILRAMSGASFADYERAYREAHKGRGVMPPSALGGTAGTPGSVGLRGPEPEKQGESNLSRTRETSDMMWRMNQYRTIDCDCGTRLRIPPGYRGESVQCPHCGDVHDITEAK